MERLQKGRILRRIYRQLHRTQRRPGLLQHQQRRSSRHERQSMNIQTIQPALPYLFILAIAIYALLIDGLAKKNDS